MARLPTEAELVKAATLSADKLLFMLDDEPEEVVRRHVIRVKANDLEFTIRGDGQVGGLPHEDGEVVRAILRERLPYEIIDG